MPRAVVTAAIAAALALAPAAGAKKAPAMWPPPTGPGTLFVHFGEEHITDADGARILPRVTAAAAAYAPRAVLTSADKGNDGTQEVFEKWDAAVDPLDNAGIPIFAAVGNHDRKHKPGFPEGVDPTGSLATYEAYFAPRPYPWGDGVPPTAADFAPAMRPEGDPAGASSHYAFDVGRTRWIVLDNSCYQFSTCDPLQNPPFPQDGIGTQMAFLRAQAEDARAKGMTVLVQFHMPTQDPRPGHSKPTPQPHTMGEGTSPENGQFESAAAELGVDGVFAGHIKGQWTYPAGGVPYFIDGGAGGEVYVSDSEKTGVDYGYWHGFRLVRVLPDGTLQTDAVPVFADGALAVDGPDSIDRLAKVGFTASGRQPTEEGPKVDLQLRAPDRERPNFENLPTPAYVWTSGDRTVLEPLGTRRDDRRDDRRTQTQTGRFRGRCPGRTTLTITAGVQSASKPVLVTGRPGAVVRSIRRRARALRVGRSRGLATVRLAQPARIRATLQRGGRTVGRLAYLCRGPAPYAIRWDGRLPRGGAAAKPGRYRLVVRVLSDQAPVTRRFAVRLRG